MSDITNLTYTTANSSYLRKEDASNTNPIVSDTSNRTAENDSVRSVCSRSSSYSSRCSSQKTKKQMTQEEMSISELVRTDIFPNVKFFPPRPAEGLATLDISMDNAYGRMVCWCLHLLYEKGIVTHDFIDDKDVLTNFQRMYEHRIIVYLKSNMAKVKRKIRETYIGMCYHSCFSV